MEGWRLIFLGAAAFFVLLAALFIRDGVRYRRIRDQQRQDAQDFLSRAVLARAWVVGVEEKIERFYAGRWNKDLRINYPVVRLWTPQGQQVETRVEVGTEGQAPALGQQLDVCYDSARPFRVRLAGPGVYPPRLNQRGPIGCLMVGYSGLFVTLAILGATLAIFVPD